MGRCSKHRLPRGTFTPAGMQDWTDSWPHRFSRSPGGERGFGQRGSVHPMPPTLKTCPPMPTPALCLGRVGSAHSLILPRTATHFYAV